MNNKDKKQGKGTISSDKSPEFSEGTISTNSPANIKSSTNITMRNNEPSRPSSDEPESDG